MKKLVDYVMILRSKNAGPLFLTFDLIFPDEKNMQEILNKNILAVDKIANLYGCAVEDVSIILYEVVNAIKITIPRENVSGCLQDEDIYGCQEHMPLAELEVI